MRGGGAEAVVACLVYSACSNAMILSNKAAVCTVCIVEGGRVVGLLSCERFNLATAKKVAPLSVLFVAMICTGGFATQFLSVPLLTVFKNLTNVVITFAENRLFHKPVSRGVLAAIAVMVGGSLCAAFNDIEFSAAGYLWMTCNCISTACCVLMMKRTIEVTALSENSLALYNNALAVPLIFLLVVFQERDVAQSAAYSSPWFVVVAALSGVVGFFMSVATFYAMGKTSVTTYSMVGALNKIVASVVGALLFHAEISPGGWAGIALGLCGGVVFALAKARKLTHSTLRSVAVQGDDGSQARGDDEDEGKVGLELSEPIAEDSKLINGAFASDSDS